MNPTNAFTPAPIKPIVSPDVLESIDIRVGTIERVEDVAKSNKLMKLTVNFGDHTRFILAGIKKERSDPQQIEGRQALFVVNLAQTLGWRWLGDVLGPKPAEAGASDFAPRERGVDALAGLLAAVGVALALPSLVSAPFAWAPVGLLVCYTGAAMGARRQGFAGMLASLGLLVVGLLT